MARLVGPIELLIATDFRRRLVDSLLSEEALDLEYLDSNSSGNPDDMASFAHCSGLVGASSSLWGFQFSRVGASILFRDYSLGWWFTFCFLLWHYWSTRL